MPEAERPDMPLYGISKKRAGMLSWDWVADQVQKSMNYWVCTTREDGRPHSVPVWGVWLDGILYFGTSRQSVKGRNLQRDPEIIVHLESGDDVVIIEGRVKETTDSAVYSRVREAYGNKYPHTPEEEPAEGQVWYEIVPQVVFGWREADFPNTATRWTFPGP